MYKLGRKLARGYCSQWLASSKQLHCGSLVLHILILFFLLCPIKKLVSQPMNFLIFMILFPIPLGREVVERASSCAVAGQG